MPSEPRHPIGLHGLKCNHRAKTPFLENSVPKSLLDNNLKLTFWRSRFRTHKTWRLAGPLHNAAAACVTSQMNTAAVITPTMTIPMTSFATVPRTLPIAALRPTAKRSDRLRPLLISPR